MTNMESQTESHNFQKSLIPIEIKNLQLPTMPKAIHPVPKSTRKLFSSSKQTLESTLESSTN